MIAEPTALAVTTPVVALIDAMAILLLLHVPPMTASVSVWEVPRQILVIPVIGDGIGITVTVVVTEQLAE
jgi:hypothetical protein